MNRSLNNFVESALMDLVYKRNSITGDPNDSNFGSRTMTSEIKKALKLIRGVASVRMARISDERGITPAIRANIKKAREESLCGETIVCNTAEDMQRYFDNL